MGWGEKMKRWPVWITDELLPNGNRIHNMWGSVGGRVDERERDRISAPHTLTPEPRTPTPVPYPLMTPSGRSRATLRHRPACSATRTTSLTSL